MSNPPPLPANSAPQKKSAKLGCLALGAIIFIVILIAAAVSGGGVAGTYSRTDPSSAGSYTSTITLRKDGTISAEIRTGYGAVDKEGTYTIAKDGAKEIHVTWNSQKFYNVIGPRPQTDREQTWTYGSGYVAIGETTYRKQSSQ